MARSILSKGSSSLVRVARFRSFQKSKTTFLPDIRAHPEKREMIFG
ncbi:hypothetical protein BSS2_II0784 [Brucella suis bv. 1 str. S2]|uniref:Uncharacterized protein n=2 Tax=Brucella suis TaxID=29461 RepID=A0A0H3G761_BRUSU|nr:hypothetical protein BRA0829 [Brucella suis 1330]ABY39782.1 Hypothetical protein, conserved [Brucella suis ATCC 23445]AEU07951.1 hypothetical protein BSVBI22_B0821 [Brucella suis VBI22]AHN48547.1 hypothetical protein BSS2_II0784 [Brucella suis bv. 1 str. S2]EFM59664.1 Hypothetical protein BIBO2_1429 [Brucella sp. BO2]EFM61763.1 Hypothetical protein BROD_2282 [Brucella sp. NF 2653]CDL78357.1 unnamed protein product [Brucella canis str. Oliveri]